MRVFTRLLPGTIAILLISFVGFKSYPILHGPQIDMNTVTDGTTLDEPLVALSGQAKYTKDLIINGNTIDTSPDGSFKDTILLSPGYNIITMQATDKFGKTSIKNYSIVLHENDNGTFTANVPPYLGGI